MQTPTTLAEAVNLARQLMQDDPASFKQGYTLENAAIAVSDVFGFDRKTIENELHNLPIDQTDNEELKTDRWTAEQIEREMVRCERVIFEVALTGVDASYWVDRVSKLRSLGETINDTSDESNEDGWNRDVPPFDNDPRTDDEIKAEVYARDEDD